MTDERFEHDLRWVLRDVAGQEAPASLRNRISRILDETPMPHRQWFASPLRLSLAAVVAVAVIALAIILVPPRLVGPSPSQSPAASQPSASPTETATPEATTTPTASPTPRPTIAPTPAAVAAWTGLDWPAGVAGPSTKEGRGMVGNALAWGYGYVAVGWFVGQGDTFATAFFTSSDGMHWTMVQRGTAVPSTTGEAEDAGLTYTHLVATTGGLIAMTGSPMNGGSAPALWRSTDGRSWTAVDSPTWRGAWDAQVHGSGTLIAVAARGGRIVALGVAEPRCCDGTGHGAIIVTSTDGQVWTRLATGPTFDRGYPRDLAAFGGGFVIVGKTGNVVGSDGPPPPVMGRPAAWTSPDGLTWTSAQVEGAEDIGVGLGQVIVGHDGLFAIGRRAGAPSATLVGAGFGATSGWASADGRTWRLVGDLGKELPDIVRMDGDGLRMVIFGRTSCKASDITGWTSTDGANWSRLAFSGSPPSQPIPGPICQDDGTEGWNDGGQSLSLTVVVPDGVLVATNLPLPAPQELYFATAVVR
jgi:hypothetical protein